MKSQLDWKKLIILISFNPQFGKAKELQMVLDKLPNNN